MLSTTVAERDTTAVHVQLPRDPLGASGRVAEARRQEREALSRYRSLIVAALESLRKAGDHFRAASDAIDKHIQQADLAAVTGRRLPSRLRSGMSGSRGVPARIVA
jgi:outer membrane protein TolC